MTGDRLLDKLNKWVDEALKEHYRESMERKRVPSDYLLMYTEGGEGYAIASYVYAKTSSIIRAERLDRPELREKELKDVLDDFARAYKTFYQSPKCDVSNSAYEEYYRIRDKFYEAILVLIPDVDKVFEEIEKYKQLNQDTMNLVFIFSKDEWQALRDRHGGEK